jgi:putative addiction module component
MSVDQIVAEALRLPEKDRAGLASRLLRSLPPVAFDDDEGVAEALRRDAELDADPAQAISLRDLDSHIEQHHKS